MGYILFIYWVFSFDLIKIKELAEERIRKDNVNIHNINNIKKDFINNIDNNSETKEELFINNFNDNKKENLIKKNENNALNIKGKTIEMNDINI